MLHIYELHISATRTGPPTIDTFDGSLSTLELHVLLALADAPLYGYAITDAVERESDGALTPRAGTLYRVLARLMGWGFVAEQDPPPGADENHPGRPRRWYALTPEGRTTLADEARRLAEVAALAARKLDGLELKGT